MPFASAAREYNAFNRISWALILRRSVSPSWASRKAITGS